MCVGYEYPRDKSGATNITNQIFICVLRCVFTDSSADIMPPRKQQKRDTSDEDSESKDLSFPESISSLWTLHASKSNWEHLHPFLEGYCVPGTSKPHIHKESNVVDNLYQPSQDCFFEYEGTLTDNLLDMLSFLFDGDKRRIDLVNILVENLKGSDKFELKFLDILDSNPIPETQNPDDYVCWSERVTRLLDTCKETLIGPVFACFMRIIRHLSVIYKTRACFPHSRHAAGSSDSFHTLWRKVLEDLLEILCPVFSETITQHYGNLALSTSYQRCQNLKDRIRFVKHYEAGQRYIRKKKIGRSHNDHQVATTDLVRAYSVIVEPDLIIKSMIKPKDGRFAEMSALTIEIGPQCVSPNMLFVATSDSETSSSSVYTANAKEEDEAYEMEDVLDSAGSTKKPKPAKEEFQLVGTKVRSQHLLEMISSARANLASIDNNEWIKRVDIKGSSLKTAGMLWFHNAVFLTKLDAKISHLDGNEHQGSQSGKYILYEKYFNPLNGHWKLLAFYWLATSLSAHILEDPNNPNCTSS